jgi:diguanylate cyclase (GGDEF)-like protein
MRLALGSFPLALAACLPPASLAISRLARGDLSGAVCLECLGVVLLAVARSERQRQRAAHEATRDPLTGLLNRRALLAAGRRLELRAARGVRAAVLLVDVNDFKAINDTWGHEAGDRALRQIASRLEGSVRENDIVARLGGDEFVLLLEGESAGQEGARRVATELATSPELVAVDGHGVPVTLSVGTAVLAPGESLATAMRRADGGMYGQKRTR